MRRKLMARRLAAGLLVVIASAPVGCSRKAGSGGALGTFPMGERVRVGPLLYTVQDAEWHDQLGEGVQSRMPQHRFLTIRLSVTNSGIRPAEIPPMSLISADGQTYPELTGGAAVPEWLGYLRSVAPAATEHGRVLFDVPSGSYRLRVTAVTDADEEPFALVEIPFQVAPAPPLVPQTPAR